VDPYPANQARWRNATESDDLLTSTTMKDIDAPGMCRMPVGGGKEEQFLDVPRPAIGAR